MTTKSVLRSGCVALVVASFAIRADANYGGGSGGEPRAGAPPRPTPFISSLLRQCGAEVVRVQGAGKFVTADRAVTKALQRPLGSVDEEVIGLTWRVSRFTESEAAWLAGVFPRLRHLAIDGAQIERQALATVAEMPRLESLSMQGWRSGAGRLTDADLAPLAAAKRLRYLDISGHRIDGESLGGLSSLETLVAVVRNRIHGIKGDGIRAIGRLKRLSHLELRGATASGSALEALGRLPELETLELGVVTTGDPNEDGSAPLAAIAKGCPHLRRFALPGELITPRSIPHLREFKNLRSLTLRWAPLTDEVFAAVASLPRLETLECISRREMNAPLDEPQEVTSELSLSRLVGAKSLRTLEIRLIEVTDDQLASMPPLPTIEELHLHAVQLTDRGVAKLAALPNLRSLELHNVGGLPYPVLFSDSSEVTSWPEVRLEGLLSLRELSFINGRFSDVSFAGLAKLPKLRSLAFDYCALDIESARTLGSLNNVTRLRLLGVINRLDSDAFGALCEMSSLEELDLGWRSLRRQELGDLSKSQSLELLRSRDDDEVNGRIQSVRY